MADITPRVQVIEQDRRLYEKTQRLAEFALMDIRRRIESAIAQVGDRNLVRATLVAARIKSPTSIAGKAHRHGSTFQRVLTGGEDIVGLRLVCNNLQDVERVTKILQSSLQQSSLRVRTKDYISKPQLDGYRGIHLLFRFPVRMGSEKASIGCEIQVRSLLQDSWAQLSRADVYASSAVTPAGIRKSILALSKQLAKADSIAERLRVQIARPRRGSAPSAGEALGVDAAAYLYRTTFGKDPADYVVQSLLRSIEGRGIRSDAFATVLRDEAFLDQLRTAYGKVYGQIADDASVFQWAGLAVIGGKTRALRFAERQARELRAEAGAIALREAFAGLSTIGDFLKALVADDHDIARFASALGVSSECLGCETPLVDPDDFAEAIIGHYRLRGRRIESVRAEVAQAVDSSGIETGAWANSRMCNYCDHVWSKD